MKHDYTVYSVLRGLSAAVLFILISAVFCLPFLFIILPTVLFFVFLTRKTWREFKEDSIDGLKGLWECLRDTWRDLTCLHED